MSIWEKTLFEGQSEFSGVVKVTENSGTRRLVVDGFTQSIITDKQKNLIYWEKMVPEDLELGLDARVLILGFGAGTIAKIITKMYGYVAIDGVEIDPLIVDLGRRFFSMQDPNLHVVTADAAVFVKEARFRYDLICVDVFKGSQVPKKITTKDFLENAKNLLKSEGTLTINKIFTSKKELEDFENFVAAVFPKVTSEIIRGSVELSNVVVTARR